MTPITKSQDSAVASVTGPWTRTAATFASTSSRPNRATVSPTARSASASRVRSAPIATTRSPRALHRLAYTTLPIRGE